MAPWWGAAIYFTGWICSIVTVAASPTARISETEESLELEYRAGNTVVKDRIPVYRVGRARYFSAGVGTEERTADYPLFPLKVVLTAGGSSYVSGVHVVVRERSGAEIARIPAEHVTGPWLFLDLPEGFYQIEAAMGDETVQAMNVQLRLGVQKVLYMRWPREPSRPGDETSRP